MADDGWLAVALADCRAESTLALIFARSVTVSGITMETRTPRLTSRYPGLSW